MNKKEVGFLGENLAGRYLENKGYEILERNYKKPWGEVDIIAEKDSVVIFVEVKTNKNDSRSDFAPELRVDRKKLSHISKVASFYLEKAGWLGGKEWRVDIVSVMIDEAKKSAKIRHFKNVAEAVF